MQEVDQLIMIVPTVLNLNGNLEMNLSARLGTAANIGELDDPLTRRSILVGSLALLQVQTVSVSFVAACIALILGTFVPKTGPSIQIANNAMHPAVRDLFSYRSETSVGRKSGIPT